MSSLPTLLRSSSLQASSLTETPGFAASRVPSQDLQQPVGHSPRQASQPSRSTQQQRSPQGQPPPGYQTSLGGRGTGLLSGSAPPPPPAVLSDPAIDQPWTELLGGLWGGFVTGVVQLVWLLGRVAVPTACVVLAASQADVLHGVYLVIMLAYLLLSCIGLQPQPRDVPQWWSSQYACSSSSDNSSSLDSGEVQPGPGKTRQHQLEQLPHALPATHLPQHRVLRLYGSCHLLVVYLALVLQLPGLDSELNEYILRLIGLWDPKILSDLLPVLLLLVAATTHVVLGKWLLSRPPAGQTWHAARRAGDPAGGPATAATAAAGPGVRAAVASSSSNSAVARPGVLAWLQAVYARPMLQCLLAAAKLACSAGSALLVLLVGWAPPCTAELHMFAVLRRL